MIRSPEILRPRSPSIVAITPLFQPRPSAKSCPQPRKQLSAFSSQLSALGS
jgi:hypothetical protein